MKKFNISKMQIVFGILAVAVMVINFRFSCENADDSSETSGFFTSTLLHILYRDFDSFTADRQEELRGIVDHIVRKTAHFTVYASLGFCTSLAVGRRKLLSWGSLCAVGICFLYACSDELHQYFVPGRACMFTDVLLDTCGGLTGMLVTMLIMRIFFKKFRVQN